MHSIVTNQLFSSCCRMWIAHVLHANEWKQQNGVGKERRLPGVKGDGCCHLRWLAVAETVPAITVFTGSSLAFTISLCFLFFFFYSSSFSFSFFSPSVSPTFFALLSRSPFSCVLLASFFSRPFPPCFYRQKIGERDRGGAACCRPSTALPTRGKFLGKFVLGRRLFDVFLEGEVSENKGKKKSSSSPTSCV